MLVFSCLSPHSPLLVPSIGKENQKRLKATIEAMEDLEKKLFDARPEIIIIISPHGTAYSDAFTISLNPTYAGNLKEFGDFNINLKFRSAPQLVEDVRYVLEQENIPHTLESKEVLDYGTVVPLYFLARRLENAAIVPISPPFLDYKTHFEFGKVLKEKILESNKRIAVIVSGDLSHGVLPDAPGGFKGGKKFDDGLIELLSNKNTAGILKLDTETAKEADACGLRGIIILLGILDKFNYKFQNFSYEAPFGIGYLVANFKLL